jgi:hypothetical protein
MQNQEPLPKPDTVEEPREEGLDETTCCALWESIETAPKNGTEILVWREDAGTMLARWISPAEFMTEKELQDWSDDDAWESDWFYADFIAGGRLDEHPTHWTTLPSLHNVEVSRESGAKRS